MRLVEDLAEFGFELNPYDPFVAHKMVNGAQMTVMWHVDELKVLHRNGVEITKLFKFLSKKYGNKFTVYGKIHDYLGMDFDYSEESCKSIHDQTLGENLRWCSR